MRYNNYINKIKLRKVVLTMTNKMTQRDFYKEIVELAKANEREDIVEFCEGRIAVLDKKASNKKPTKTQEENEVLKGVILDTLTNEGVTVTDLQAKDETLGGLSNQRVSALLRQLITDGKVAKVVDKKKSYFSLVVAE
jgi:catechol-2,3-dioxygenase